MFLPAPDESLWVGVLRLGLFVPESRSLKDKRRVVASVRDRLRARHSFSVAEVGHLEDHHRAVLAVSTVGNDSRVLRSALDAVSFDLQSWCDARIESAEVVVIRPFGVTGTQEDWHG